MQIRADNLSKYFGADLIFRQVNFTLADGFRVGLVGPNGQGKTTLMRIILGAEEISGGEITATNNLQLGYLPQVPPTLDDRTVWEFCQGVFRRLFEIENELADLARCMARPDCPETVLQRYDRLQHEFEIADGYTRESRIHCVLAGLGFSAEQIAQPMSTLSGGWRTRVYLAHLLLREPDILMLDEPTNHLDMAAVRWLEGFLQNWSGILLVVSHDRYLLNRVTNRIWELADATLETYKGNYDEYLLQREQRFEERLKTYEQQQAFICETEAFIRQHIAGQRSKEAQGRRKRLARFVEREAIPKPRRMRGIKVSLPSGKRTGDQVLRTRDLEIGYDGQTLARIPNLALQRQARLGVVGGNGTGKTSLLKTLQGTLPAVAGKYEFGANVKCGYLSQLHAELQPDQTILEAVREVQKVKSDSAARDLLGALLFSGDDVFKLVGDLSGGERSRLALARLGLQGANLLLLDEPTNHLDIQSQEVLQDILRDYPGTLLIVSHDRFLIDHLATELLVFEDREVKYAQGSWSQYVESAKAAAEVTAAQAEDSGKSRNYRHQKRQQNAQKRLRSRYDTLETGLHELEERKKLLEYAISKAGENQNVAEVNKLSLEFQQLEATLADHWDEWTRLVEQLETWPSLP